MEAPAHFSDNASMIRYSAGAFSRNPVSHANEVELNSTGSISWFNVYGLNYTRQFSEIAQKNNLDAFLVTLIGDTHHRTKVVDLSNCFFFTAKSIHFDEKAHLTVEQMMFIVSSGFIWSIQEKRGDNFGHIRQRLADNVGDLRQKGTDYLLFLILESIVDNYYTAYSGLTENFGTLVEWNGEAANPEVLQEIENRKSQLFRIRKSLNNLREAIYQITLSADALLGDDSRKYFTELREQGGYLIDQIDHDLQRLESATNLFFSLQSHRLNEVMKTLTILSAVFIPLTFIAGIYGMNFEYMPELRWEHGYFVILAVMLVMGIASVFYFRRKGWF